MYAAAALRSDSDVPVFEAHAASRHDVNVEVLADILVLAHADLLLHGASAVSEAAHWLAFPRLHNRSAHLEYDADSRTHDPSSFVRAALATAPAVGRSARLDADWTLPPPNDRSGPAGV